MANRVTIREPMRRITVPLASGAVVYSGETLGAISGTHTCDEVSSTTNMKTLGTAVEDADQTAGDVDVQIDLFEPVNLQYFDNASTGAVVLANHFLSKVWFTADNKVTTADTDGGTNLAFAGIVYDVSTRDGVGIKPVSTELGELLS